MVVSISRCRFVVDQIQYNSDVVLSSADSCRNIHIYTGYIPTQ